MGSGERIIQRGEGACFKYSQLQELFFRKSLAVLEILCSDMSNSLFNTIQTIKPKEKTYRCATEYRKSLQRLL